MHSTFETMISQRIQYLGELIKEKEDALRQVPEGRLHGAAHGKGWQYYCRQKGDQSSGKYIRKENHDLIKILGQKEYDLRVLLSARKELERLQSLQIFYQQGSPKPVEQIYSSLPEWNQVLADPVQVPLDQFVRSWMDEEYQGLEHFKTNENLCSFNHEYMRSKSEVLIANTLYRYHIPYHYEKPLDLGNGLLVYPDFTALDIKTREQKYWEHLGLIDNPEYSSSAFRKIREYEMHGIFLGSQLIITYETNQQPLNTRLVEAKVRHYFNV